MEIAVTVFLPLLLGLFLIGYGVRMRMGYHKTWYMKPWVRAGSNIYMLIPLGIMSLLWGIAGVLGLLFPRETMFVVNRVILALGAATIIVGVLLAFIRPNYVKPTWLRRLEQEHSDVLHILREEANAMGYPHWEDRVRTQEDLEKWVAEVRHKHGL